MENSKSTQEHEQTAEERMLVGFFLLLNVLCLYNVGESWVLVTQCYRHSRPAD